MIKIFLFVVLQLQAWAYIPEYSTLMSKAAGQHGRGVYQIDQEVLFQKDSESYAIKETWIVANESTMRVTFEGRGILKGAVSGAYVYDGNQRFYADPSGSVRSHRLSEDWLNPFLHFRNSKYVRNRLVNMKIAPGDSLRDRAPMPIDAEKPKYEAPGFVRLARVGGSVNYAIGLPPQMGVTPTAWLEQDQFVFRKIRTSNLNWRADDYQKYGDFWYPKNQTYNWGPYTVSIQTLQVKPLASAGTLFKSSSLQPQRDTLRMPEVDALKEFFSRFR